MKDAPPLKVEAVPDGEGVQVTLQRPGGSRVHRLADWRPDSVTAFLSALAADTGARAPGEHIDLAPADSQPNLRPLLVENAGPGILYGYGDPSVLRTRGPDGDWRWWLVCTSNDAPDAFPLLWSDDLQRWTPAGFVFPRGAAPAWALSGFSRADFWAPELHRVGGTYWLCFCARGQDGRMAIGLARADRPEGPWRTDPEPLLDGHVIDAHLAQDGERVWLIWKADNNGLWPGRLEKLIALRSDLLPGLFPDPRDRRTAELWQALRPWTATLDPMQRFVLRQPLIEAVTDDFAGFRERLKTLRQDTGTAAIIDSILDVMRTPVYAQQLSPDGRSLIGERTLLLENDLPWEAHLIEGCWVERAGEGWALFYAGNDFSSARYGIGVAFADRLLGPYVKRPEPLLRSSTAWSAPGHPSVAPGPDGRPHLFLHAYRPGEAGYKAFRALLTTPITFKGRDVRLG